MIDSQVRYEVITLGLDITDAIGVLAAWGRISGIMKPAVINDYGAIRFFNHNAIGETPHIARAEDFSRDGEPPIGPRSILISAQFPYAARTIKTGPRSISSTTWRLRGKCSTNHRRTWCERAEVTDRSDCPNGAGISGAYTDAAGRTVAYRRTKIAAIECHAAVADRGRPNSGIEQKLRVSAPINQPPGVRRQCSRVTGISGITHQIAGLSWPRESGSTSAARDREGRDGRIRRDEFHEAVTPSEVRRVTSERGGSDNGWRRESDDTNGRCGLYERAAGDYFGHGDTLTTLEG